VGSIEASGRSPIEAAFTANSGNDANKMQATPAAFERLEVY
jgi:hypothetical protein